MRIDGLWTAQYFGSQGWSDAGALVLEDGRVMGGNNRHVIVGGYQVAEEKVTMKLEVSFFDSPYTVFRVRNDMTPFKVEGKWEDDTFQGKATRIDVTGLDMPFRMVRRSNLRLSPANEVSGSLHEVLPTKTSGRSKAVNVDAPLTHGAQIA